MFSPFARRIPKRVEVQSREDYGDKA